MSASSKSQGSPCPVTFALDVFGDRWTLRVLRDVLLDSRYGYKDLLVANSGIATNVLADRLKRLEARNLVTKTRDPADARQFLYKPTELAISVIPMLVEMIIWGSKHGNGTVDAGFIQRYERDRPALLKELQTGARQMADL
jgi:DNA-binding HxlR family transcriptional regulator